MSEETENLVLQQLRVLRNDIVSMRSELRTSTDELRARVGRLEHEVAHSTASTSHQYAELSTRMDIVNATLTRISRRLEIGGPIARPT